LVEWICEAGQQPQEQVLDYHPCKSLTLKELPQTARSKGFSSQTNLQNLIFTYI
jgi:hypothetical protein